MIGDTMIDTATEEIRMVTGKIFISGTPCIMYHMDRPNGTRGVNLCERADRFIEWVKRDTVIPLGLGGAR